MRNEPTVIVDVEDNDGTTFVKVIRREDGIYYDVWVRDTICHPECTAESAMRALAAYTQQLLYSKRR